MPDNPPRFGRLPLALAVAAGLVLAAGAVAVTRDADVAGLATVLASATDATVTLPGAAPRALLPGEQLVPGAVVTTGSAGTARLVTDGRLLDLAGGTVLTVLDGAHTRLTQGAVLLDARHGPGLSVSTDAGTAVGDDGSLLRVERSAVLRLADYSGDGSVQAADRTARREVTALRQVVVPPGGLPSAATPLALTVGDPWEARVLPQVVSDDTALRALATGLDSGTGSKALVARVQATLAVPTTTAVVGEPPSETALAYALADTAQRGGSTAAERYRLLRGDRDAGGSWGVLSALYSARPSAVSGVLDGLLGAMPGGAGSGPALAAGNPGSTGDALGQLLGGGATGTTSGGSTVSAPATSSPVRSSAPTRRSGSRSGSGSGSGGRAPMPVPSPSGVLQTVVDTVLGLLPGSAPSGTSGTSGTVKKSVPTPTPSRTPSSLLGIVPLG